MSVAGHDACSPGHEDELCTSQCSRRSHDGSHKPRLSASLLLPHPMPFDYQAQAGQQASQPRPGTTTLVLGRPTADAVRKRPHLSMRQERLVLRSIRACKEQEMETNEARGQPWRRPSLGLHPRPSTSISTSTTTEGLDGTLSLKDSHE